MAGPASPGGEGPTFAPPPLPAGWIAQWDGTSRKYYFVQLSTGVSQWDTPTEPAPVGGSTPAAAVDHPFGGPPGAQGGPRNGGGGGGGEGGGGGSRSEIITHPDGSQTVRHPDGRMEPVLAPEDGARAGVDGPAGERGIGSFLMNAVSNNASAQHAGQSPLGQLMGGLMHSGGGGGGGSSGIGGKLASQLASSLFSTGRSNNNNSSSSSSSHKPPQPQNYHGGPTHTPSNTGGLAGSLMGGVSSFLGGNQHSSAQNFGYSNSGTPAGGYSGQAPPTSYQPPSSASSHQPQHGSKPPYSHSQPESTSPYRQPAGSQPYAQGAAHSQSYSQQGSAASYQGGSSQGYAHQAHNHVQSQGHYGGPPSQSSPSGYGGPGSGSGSGYQVQHQQPGYGHPQSPPGASYQPAYANMPPPSASGGYPQQPTYGGQSQCYGGGRY